MSGPYITGAEAPDPYYKKKGSNKVNFLTRWFDRKCRESWERTQTCFGNSSRHVNVISEEPVINTEGLTIRLFGATGGQIVEFRKYDRNKDQNNIKLYVINVEQNFSEELAKIVSLEILR